MPKSTDKALQRNTITIPGELTSLNDYIRAERGSRYAGNDAKKQETERVAWAAKASGVPPVAGYPVHISFLWYSPDARKDIDNVAFAAKFVLDGLVMAGILENDSRKHVASLEHRFMIDKVNPRVEAVITPYL